MRAAAALVGLLAVAGCGPAPPAGSGLVVLPAARAEAAHKPLAQWLSVRPAAPELAFVDARGEPVSLRRFSGRVVVLNLWATWCPPCVREMPSLDGLARRVPEIAVVPVSMDLQGPQRAADFLKQKGLDHLEVYHDAEGRLMRELGAFGLPASVVIDRNGRVAATVQGEIDWTRPEMLKLLASM